MNNYIMVRDDDNTSGSLSIELVYYSHEIKNTQEFNKIVLGNKWVLNETLMHPFRHSHGLEYTYYCKEDTNHQSPNSFSTFVSEQNRIGGGRFALYHAEFIQQFGPVVVVKSDLQCFTDEEFKEFMIFAQDGVDYAKAIMTYKKDHPISFYSNQIMNLIRRHLPIILFLLIFTLIILY